MMRRIQCHITSGQSMSINRSGDDDEENTVSYHIRTVCLSMEGGMMMMRIQCHITSGQSMCINRSGDDEEENTVTYHIRTVHVYQ